MTVLLHGDWGVDEAQVWRLLLEQALPEETLLCDLGRLSPAQRAGVDVAVVANPPPGWCAGLPGLRLIQSVWAGVDRLLADPTLPPQVPVARMVDPAMGRAMAETAAWAVLGWHRRFFAYGRQQRARLWQTWPPRRADEVPVAVLGLGRLGTEVARRLTSLGYPVAAWCSTPRPETPALQDVEVLVGEAGLARLLPRSQVLVNLLPLTASTRGVLSRPLFEALPRGAAVVNLARGAHLVEADLLAALASGQLSHAVLDVFDTEPLPTDHPFWGHPSVTVLPHVAAQTDPRSAAEVVAANVRALRAQQPLAHRVDRDKGY